MAAANKSPKAILADIEGGVIGKEDGTGSLINCLFDNDWHNDTRLAAADSLRQLGHAFGSVVVEALGTTVKKGDPKAQERLAELQADALVKWLVVALNSNPETFRGQGVTIAKFTFHWTHAIRVAGWLKRRELIAPLVLQLLVDETGNDEVELVGKALANYGDDAVDALLPLLSNSKLVWTRIALEKEPIAARAFAVLQGRHPSEKQLLPDFPSKKALAALKKGKGWWNMRRFDSSFRATVKMR